ncbi:hypothetical protein [Bradyrhizobium sp.]
MGRQRMIGGPIEQAARREIRRLAYEINVRQYACVGLNFGACRSVADHRL